MTRYSAFYVVAGVHSNAGNGCRADQSGEFRIQVDELINREQRSLNFLREFRPGQDVC